jgi:hypothetical protein
MNVESIWFYLPTIFVQQRKLVTQQGSIEPAAQKWNFRRIKTDGELYLWDQKSNFPLEALLLSATCTGGVITPHPVFTSDVSFLIRNGNYSV